MGIRNINRTGYLPCQLVGVSLSWSTYLLSVFLLIAGRSLALSPAHTTTTLPSAQIVKLCCPDGLMWDTDSDQCSATSDLMFDKLAIPLNSSSNITWEHHPLTCSPGYVARSYPLVYFPPRMNESALLETEDGIIVFEITELLNSRRMDYCVKSLPSGNFIGDTCRPNVAQLCKDATCVQKCCDEGNFFNASALRCEPDITKNFTLNFRSVSGIDVSQPSDLIVLTQFPICMPITARRPVAERDHEFYLLREGILYLPVEKKIYKENEFCVGNVLFGEAVEPAAFVCEEPGLPIGPTPRIYAYSVGVIISALFLLVTIIFHLCIPQLRDMQGLCLLSHVISLFVANIALFVGYIFTAQIHDDHCVINAFILQYSLLAAFFWLNIMCFDVWRVIRATLKIIPLSGILSNDKKRFVLYSLYSWGGPFIICLVTIILHYVPRTTETTHLTPGFGVVSCWFQGELERFVFFYCPIAIICIGNVIMLAHTTAMLYQAGASICCCQKKTLFVSSCNRGHIEAFWHRFSLFMVMVISWVTEILSWKIPPEELWYATDFLNTLQGFFVFVIFISYKKKSALVKEFVAKTIRRFSDAGRKVSRSEETCVTWHTSKDTSSTNDGQDIPTKKKEAQMDAKHDKTTYSSCRN